MSSTGAQGDADSFSVSMSADGRWVAFSSEATNLTPGDAIGFSDVFVRDRQSGTTELADVDPNGVVGDQGGYLGALSADGRFVAFWSRSTNLVPGATNGFIQVYVHDRWTGATEIASTDSNGVEANRDCSYEISLSADGRYVLFESEGSNLVPGDTNGWQDVFVHDRQTGATERVSVAANGQEGDLPSGYYFHCSSLSADGRFALFASAATNLVSGDTNGRPDIFVKDRQDGSIDRVNVSTAGSEADNESIWCDMSGDGRFVAFESYAANLVPGDTNGRSDVFVRDRQLGVTTRISVNSSGEQGNANSTSPRITDDGRYVAFVSVATNFVPGTHDSLFHAFVHDRVTGTTIEGDVNGQGEIPDEFISPVDLAITADGRRVAFTSHASNVVPGDTNGVMDVFLHDFGPDPATSFCFGDGSGASCPCGNSGTSFRGCENSASTGGAILEASGLASLGDDHLRLSSYGERAQALSIVLQGDLAIAPEIYGDGLRCVGGNLYRMYARNASLGILSVPQGTDLSISARSAALGDPIPAGATRYYQVYYRDPPPTFCPDPPGNTWNIGNAVGVAWGP